MASQSLYRKWRSQNFSEMVGQEPVIRTLKNALNSGNLAHAYLFTGPRGTGKTSTARLLAKTINCPNAVDGEPCNVCEQCREITAGNSFNVVEIDAASNRGIDSIRELREKVLVPPTTGKYKVYILDEAHMLTVEAFNALLKTLEEPPAHAIFVMATTDVHKMLPTVLSRCQRFDFKRFTLRQIVDHLQYIASQEGIKLEDAAATLLARAAAGGMRDALSLLDQATAYSGQEISLTQVQSMLGVADPRAIQKFITHVAEMDGPGGLHLIHELAEAGADLRQLNTQIAEYWRAMMLARAGANIGEILDQTEDEIREITQLARLFALEELTESARLFAQNELMQKSQGTPQLGLELALLACLELHRRGAAGLSAAPAVAAPAPAPRSSIVQERSQPPRVTASEPVVPLPAPPVAAPLPAPPRVPVTEPEPPLPDWDEMPPDDEEEVPAAPSIASQSREPAPVEKAAVPVPEAIVVSVDAVLTESVSLTIEEVKEKWELIKRRIRSAKDGSKISALLNGYVIVGVEGGQNVPVVVIRANMDFHYKAFHQNASHLNALEWAMKLELGQECRARLLPPGQAGPGGVSIPAPSPRTTGGQMVNSALAATPHQSARRERNIVPPAASPASPPPASRPVQQATAPSVSQKPVSSAPVSVATLSSTPLAKSTVVSENITGSPPAVKETRQTSVERMARDNQIVKEVMRMYKADIKEIHPK